PRHDLPGDCRSAGRPAQYREDPALSGAERAPAPPGRGGQVRSGALQDVMTRAFGCEDREQLVALLYGEADREEQAAIEAHLATCPACASEYAALREVRTTLTAWEPPHVELGFRIVRDSQPARRWWHVPVWVPAALAAVLLLAVGAALS